MGEKALWPTVILVSVICASITTALIFGVDVVKVIAAFGVAGSIMQVMLYGKIQRVENNTNGNAQAQLEMIKDLVEHVKMSVPIDTVAVVKSDTDK